MIGSGYQNEIHGKDTYGMFIGAGRYNFITGSTDAIIGAGYRNRIEKGATASGIFTGIYNKILEKTVGTDPLYSAIVNGSGNTIGDSCQSSAIIGSNSRTATQSQTTYLRGLDALTNSSAGDKKFKYHGTWANTGLNYILTDSDGSGNAQWRINTNPGVSWTGDCAVMSAYTTGCTLFMQTNCTGSTPGAIIVGGYITYTANTCNTFGNISPYRYGLNSAIEPILGVNNADGLLSNIGGGQGNTVDINSQWSNIGSGLDNTITNTRVSSILGGRLNTVNIAGWDNGYGTVVNGFTNTVNHQYSVIMGCQHDY